jgi:hypothetical protein
MSTGGKKRTDEELLEAIDQAAADDDLAEIAALTSEQVDATIRAQGGDPEAIGARGAQLARELLERRKRLAWQGEARRGLEAAQAKMAQAPRTPKLPRPELLARLAAAQKDARFSAPIAAAFRKRTAQESSDEELRRLLDEIEMLRMLEPS